MRTIVACSCLAVAVASASGQFQPAGAPRPATPASPAPPPATKLEAFSPSAGSLLRIGYTELGKVGYDLVTVDVREVKDLKTGSSARGVVAEVHESQYREERAFIDADEVPELVAGMDALMDVKTNPTTFKSFEVHYTTRGGFELSAFNTARDEIKYMVRAGRVVPASMPLDEKDFHKLREMLIAAEQKLSEPSK